MYTEKSPSPDLPAFEPLEQITANHRFETYRGTYDGKPVFLKIPVEDRLKDRLKNEIEGIQEFYKHDPEGSLYRVPKIIKLHDDYLVTEFISGYQMSLDFDRGDKDKILKDIAFLVDTYLFFDNFPGGIGNTRFNLPRQKPKTTQILEQLNELDKSMLFDNELARKMIEYIDHIASELETRYTHGDLQPGNVIVTDGAPVIVDFETCSSTWPRHYNIVNFVINYKQKYPELRDVLADAFWHYCERAGVDPRARVDTFNAIAGMRSIQMMVEMLLDSQRSGEPIEKQAIDYVNANVEAILEDKLFIDAKDQ